MSFVIRRILAYMLDVIVLSFIVMHPFKKYFNISTVSDITRDTLTAYIITAILVILYFAVMEFYFGQTIGKYIMKIKVKSKTKKLLFGQCFLRSISKFSGILYLIDLLYLLKNKKQRYLEFKSKTLTVRK